MNDLIKFDIPAEFVAQQGIHLNDAELAYGFRNGWIDAPALVAISLSELKAGRPLSDAQDALALLLPSDYYDVPDLVDALERSATMPASEAAKVWQFLAVAWIYEHAQNIEETYEPIAMLAADYGYPPDLRPLVHYMPVELGATPGPEHLANKFKNYFETKRAAFKARK